LAAAIKASLAMVRRMTTKKNILEEEKKSQADFDQMNEDE